MFQTIKTSTRYFNVIVIVCCLRNKSEIYWK